jgi:DNA invertase Pin-like site-specific DNA recombinase
VDTPNAASLPPAVTAPHKIRDTHRQRLAIVYVRQSSAEQVREHRGSEASQADQARFARDWGWPATRIHINRQDLGFSGTSTSHRRGFLEILAKMSAGEVGIILVSQVDRLNRKLGDFDNLLEIAADTETLLCIDGTVYDPSSEDVSEMLSLQVQGMFGAFDNRLRAKRMMAARIAKAHQGQAVSPPPVGYLREKTGRWVKDPDMRVQEVIKQLFAKYLELRSLGKVVRYFRDNHPGFPRRVAGDVRFGPCDAALIHTALRNPAYAGDYVFRRHQSKKRDGRVKVTLRPENEWIIKRDHHEPYVSRDTWEQVQAILRSHRPSMRSLAGKGHALLQGIIRCNQCQGHPMTARYWGHDGMARTAKYLCTRTNEHRERIHKSSIPARLLDAAVTHHVLHALRAIDGDSAHAVIAGAEAERAAIEQNRHLRLRTAEDQVTRLRRLLISMADLPDAHADLKIEFDAAARRVNTLKAELEPSTSPRSAITVADIEELVHRTRNVHDLWKSPRRSPQDRKQLIRAVVSEVVVLRADIQTADVEIVWKGGLRQPVTVYRSRGVDSYVADHSRAGKPAQQVADDLNAAGVVTATGRPVSANVILQKQGRLGLRLKDERHLARQIIRDGLMNDTPRTQLLQQLEERAPRLGPWDPQRLSEAIRQLRKGVAGIDPLPRLLPYETRKQIVLRIVEEGIAAGKDWVDLATELNRSGHRPPRGSAFTPVQLRALYLRSRGLRSFRLPAATTESTTKETQ